MSRLMDDARAAIENIDREIATYETNPLMMLRVFRAQQDALKKLLAVVAELETKIPAVEGAPTG